MIMWLGGHGTNMKIDTDTIAKITDIVYAESGCENATNESLDEAIACELRRRAIYLDEDCTPSAKCVATATLAIVDAMKLWMDAFDNE